MPDPVTTADHDQQQRLRALERVAEAGQDLLRRLDDRWAADGPTGRQARFDLQDALATLHALGTDGARTP